MTPTNTFSLTDKDIMISKSCLAECNDFLGNVLVVSTGSYHTQHAEKLKQQILTALKLQQLVKAEMIKPHLVNTSNILRQLLEESEK